MPSRRFLFCLVALAMVALFCFQTAIDNHPAIIRYDAFQISQNSNFPDFEQFPLGTITNGNVPLLYIDEKSKKPTKFNKTCAKFPQLFDLKFNNDLWQVQQTTNGSFYLFNAYLDRRNENVTMVRIMGLYPKLQPKNRFYCQFWYGNTDLPTMVQTDVLYWMFRPKWGADRDGFLHPYLITCPLMGTKIPMSVSIVEKPCDNPSNNLKLIQRKFDKKKNFVVCVKGMDFPNDDKSARLIEWIELLNILGAEKINFYEFKVHPNTKKVLDYYESKGMVEVTPITLAGDFSNNPILRNRYLHKKLIERRLQEVIPYNDCLYKHLEEFKFVVLLDTDEVIVPIQDTWVEMIETTMKTSGAKSAYLARNIYFFDTYQHNHEWFDGIPIYMHMLQHVYRAKNYTKPGYFVKGFHDVDRVVALHNHFPLSCIGGCSFKEINLTLAHLQHYRSDCASGVGNCKDMKKNNVMDIRIWNYKDELIRRVNRTLEALKLKIIVSMLFK